jgi:hypothetical protein
MQKYISGYHNQNLAPGFKNWDNTMFFPTFDDLPYGCCARLNKIHKHYYIGTNDEDLYMIAEKFLKKERDGIFLPKSIENIEEAWILMQKFAEENNLKPFYSTDNARRVYTY